MYTGGIGKQSVNTGHYTNVSLYAITDVLAWCNSVSCLHSKSKHASFNTPPIYIGLMSVAM